MTRLTLEEMLEDSETAPMVPWLELIDIVCSEEGTDRPEVEFFDGGTFSCVLFKSGDVMLRLAYPSWALEYDPDAISSGRYKIGVLHELAHHIDWHRNKSMGHTPYMYAKLFQLCLRHGVDLQFALENETRYKPRAAKRGWNLFRMWAAL